MNKLYEGLWYRIPNYNGYFINNIGEVKSMKNFIRYPYGMMLKYTNTSNGGYYTLTSDINIREKKSKDELLSLVYNDPSPFSIQNGETYIGSRNPGYNNMQKFIDSGKESVSINIGGMIDREY